MVNNIFKRGRKMTQKRVTIGTKISEEDFERIELKGKIDGLSISALVKLLVMGYKDGDIEIKDGEIVRENNEEFFEQSRSSSKIGTSNNEVNNNIKLNFNYGGDLPLLLRGDICRRLPSSRLFI